MTQKTDSEMVQISKAGLFVLLHATIDQVKRHGVYSSHSEYGVTEVSDAMKEASLLFGVELDVVKLITTQT